MFLVGNENENDESLLFKRFQLMAHGRNGCHGQHAAHRVGTGPKHV